MTTTRPAPATGSLATIVLGAYRLALRARLRRRPGAALLERPCVTSPPPRRAATETAIKNTCSRSHSMKF